MTAWHFDWSSNHCNITGYTTTLEKWTDDSDLIVMVELVLLNLNTIACIQSVWKITKNSWPEIEIAIAHCSGKPLFFPVPVSTNLRPSLSAILWKRNGLGINPAISRIFFKLSIIEYWNLQSKSAKKHYFEHVWAKVVQPSMLTRYQWTSRKRN